MPNNAGSKKSSKHSDTNQKSLPKCRKRKRSDSTDDEIENNNESTLAIEKKLRSVAKMNNLSSLEMRKLIRKLVANDHVLAFITLKAEDELAREKNEAEKTQTAAVIVNQLDPSIPKLTRSKARELNKPPFIALPSLIEPQTSEIASLIQEDLHSDEEDEEYTFKEEDFISDEDPNMTASDVDSQPRTPMTPHQAQEMESPQKFSADGIFKVPRDIGEETGEIIATRTRSKLCLQQTTIEDLQSEFVPPDDHFDVTDTEICGNDEDWMEFLNTFSKPLNNSIVGDDDDPVNDPEYVAAEKVTFDAEELRDVNISKKELADLVKELFEGLLDEGVSMETIDLETPKKFIENNKLASAQTENENNVTNKTNSQVICGQTASPHVYNSVHPMSTFNQNELIFDPLIISTPQLQSCKSRTFNQELYNETIAENSFPEKYSSNEYPNVSVPCNGFEVSYADPLSAENRIIYMPNKPSAPFNDLNKESMSAWGRERYIAAKKLLKFEYVNKFAKLKDSEVAEVSFSEDPTGFTSFQYEILQQQLRIHVQLLTQNFFQTYSHPELWKLAPQQKQMLVDLEKEAQKNATFDVWNLKPALNIVREWENELEKNSEENARMMKFIYKEMRKVSKTHNQVIRFSPRIMKKILHSPVFIYPEYLPRIPFSAQLINFHTFAPAEAFLIAMGLEKHLKEILEHEQHFSYMKRRTPLTLACERIVNSFIRGKTPRRLKDHIKELEKSDTYNPVKFYFEHQKAPPVDHNLIPIDFTNVLTPAQKPSELPITWKDFLLVLNAGGIINDLYPSNYTRFVKDISAKYIEYPSAELYTKGKKFFKGSKKQSSKENKNEVIPSVTININYLFGQTAPETLSLSGITENLTKSILELPEIENARLSVSLSPLKNLSNIAINDSEKQKKLTDFFQPIQKDNRRTSPEQVEKKLVRRSKAILKLKKYPGSYFGKKHQVVAKKFRSAKNLQKRCENLLSAYRLNLVKQSLKFSNRGLRFVFRNLKALELYTNLLKDLKMNCKKIKSNEDTSYKRKHGEEPEIPKSRRAYRQEENLRHMLFPDTAEDANRKDAIYAFNFYEKVEEVLKQSNKPDDCKKFNYILKSFNPNKDKVADLYYKLEKLFLPNHPELAQVFLTFLLPSEAAEIGKFFEHFMNTHADTFVNKLNVYFHKQPAQIRKIYTCLSELSEDPDVTFEKIKNKIFPLLKGNIFLNDWFTQLFSSEPPPERLLAATENINMKEVLTNQTGEYVETLHPNDLLDSPTESQTCQLKYINGRIFYGTKIPLPAKLSFMASSYQPDELKESLEDDKYFPTKSGCVHGIREYGEKRLSAPIYEFSSDDNEKSEEDILKYSNTDCSEVKASETCDDVSLRAHATRLNPSYYSASCYSPMSNASSSCHRQIKMVATNTEEGKISPRKTLSKSNPSTTITSSVSSFKERRKSPKKSLVKSPLSGAKRPTADMRNDSKSNAIASAKKLKTLIEEESISYNDVCKKKLHKKRKDSDFKANDDFDEGDGSNRDESMLVPNKEIKEEPIQPWTRDEDKIILEEIKSGFRDQKLYERINCKMINRSLPEIEERHKFLLDFLSKLQNSK